MFFTVKVMNLTFTLFLVNVFNIKENNVFYNFSKNEGPKLLNNKSLSLKKKLTFLHVI